MMDKKNAEILYFYVLEIVMELMNNQKILIKLSKLLIGGKLFVEIVNVLLGFYEQVLQNTIGLELKTCIQNSISIWKSLSCFIFLVICLELDQGKEN